MTANHKPTRNVLDVIDSIRKVTPDTETVFIADLESIKSSASYCAPEAQYLLWRRLQEAIITSQGRGYPALDWEFEVSSIFSTIPVFDLRVQVAEYVASFKESR